MSGNPISRIVIVVATAAVLLAGCCPAGGSNWQKIAAGEMVNKEDVDETNLRPGDIVYLGQDPRLIVIGDAVEVTSLRDRVLPSHLERIVEVDFSAYFVAVIHQGLRNRPYHPIEVNAVEFEDNVCTIHAKLYEPDRSTYEPFPANSPYYVLKIKKPAEVREEDISFVLEANGERISQMCTIPGAPVPWEAVVNALEASGGYRERPPRLAIVTDLDDLSFIQDELYSSHVELIAGVDFSTHFVIVVFQGLKSVTYYSIEVINLKQRGDVVSVCAQFHEPKGGWGQAQSSPYYVLQVEKTVDLRGDLTFVLLDGGEEVARQGAVIP